MPGQRPMTRRTGRLDRSAGRRTLLLLLALLENAAPPAAWAEAPLAAGVKAAYVYNFLKFVEWPQGALAAVETPIVLGVLGQDAVATELDGVQGRKAKARTVQVRRVEDPKDLAACQLAYIGDSAVNRLPEVFRALRGTHVLTVADSPEFIEQGGMVSFMLEGSNVRFRICPERAEAAGLKLSSQLLEVARLAACKTR